MSTLFRLTKNNTFKIFELTKNSPSYSEYVIYSNSVFGVGKVHIGRRLSNIDENGNELPFTDFVKPGTTEPLEFTTSQSGNGFSWTPQIGQIKFYVIDADNDTNILIELA